MQKKLTKLQAFNVMLFFLEEILKEENVHNLKNELSDSMFYLGDILSNSEFWPNKLPGDQAAWEDWKNSIKLVALKDKKLQNYNKLTLVQASSAMYNYVSNSVSFYRIKPIYLINLLKILEQIQNNKNKKLWKLWLDIANNVIKMEDPRYYLQFEPRD